MNTAEISVLAYLVNSIGVIFALCLFFGVMFKASMVFTAIFAYPVYLAIFTFEMFVYTKSKGDERKFFKLNIPKENPKRFFMNSAASLVVLFMLPNFLTLYSIVVYGTYNQVEAADKLVGLMLGSDAIQLWFNGLAGVFILVIFCISYFTELDQNEPLEKIEQLSIPSLWKGVLKSAS